MEHRIISACIRDRAAYDVVRQSIDDAELSDLTVQLLHLIQDYYESDTAASSIDIDLLQENIRHKYTRKKQQEIFLEFLQNLPPVSSKNISKLVYERKLSTLGEDIATELVARRYDAADVLLEKYHKLRLGDETTDSEYTVYNGVGIEDLVDKHSPENLIKIYPTSLSEAIGGGIPRKTSTNIVVFGPTNNGKSAFVVNLTYGFCKQGLKGIYIGNEDGTGQMRLRLMARFSLMTELEQFAEPKKALEIANSNGYQNLYFIPLAPGTVKDLSRLIKSYKPEFVVVDQLKNLELGRRITTNDKHPVNEVSYAVRTLGKANDLITVSVFQGMNDDYHRNKLVLTTSDLHNSKADIPGDADLMIGIGANDSFRSQNLVRLNISKWKGTKYKEYVDAKLVPEYSRIIKLGE